MRDVLSQSMMMEVDGDDSYQPSQSLLATRRSRKRRKLAEEASEAPTVIVEPLRDLEQVSEALDKPIEDLEQVQKALNNTDDDLEKMQEALDNVVGASLVRESACF